MGAVDPQRPPPHRPGRRGEALASVSGPSAGHVQCGLNSQDSSVPSWPLPVLFLRGSRLTLLPFWANWTLKDKAEMASHSQSREAVTFANQRGSQILYEDKELPVLNLTFPQGSVGRTQQLGAFP